MRKILTWILVCCVVIRCLGASQHGADTNSHIFKESIPLYSTRADLIKRVPLNDDHVHEVVFVVQQKNMDNLIQILHDVSNPFSQNYGKHMSSEQVAAMTMNPEARNAIVDHLTEIGAIVESETLNGDFITASAPISVWAEVFNTKFYLFHLKQPSGDIDEIVRAESYFVPKELHRHVNCVLNTIEIPVLRSRNQRANIAPPKRTVESKFRSTFNSLGYNLPVTLREYYNLTNVHGSEQSTQAAAGLGRNYFSPLTLAHFQRNISFQPLQPALTVGGFISEDPRDDAGEAALDIQYLMGISPVSPTTFWHAGGMVNLLQSFLNTFNPPLVLSISYGLAESYVTKNEHSSFTTMAQKLGVQGVSILVASGDDGANSYIGCGYVPDYPSSNPYVTAVGATSVRSFTRHLSMAFTAT